MIHDIDHRIALPPKVVLIEHPPHSLIVRINKTNSCEEFRSKPNTWKVLNKC